MIQRIQSLYLLLTIVASLLFLTDDFLRFSTGEGSEFELTAMGIFKGHNGDGSVHKESYLPLSAVSFLVPLVFSVSVFLYRKRKLQKKMITAGIILVLLMIVLIIPASLDIMKRNNAFPMPGIRLALILIMILFPIFAIRAIRNDERLLNSIDRLR